MFDSLKRVIVYMDPKRTLFLGLFYLNSTNKKIQIFDQKHGLPVKTKVCVVPKSMIFSLESLVFHRDHRQKPLHALFYPTIIV